jgi:hypothetical protein
MDNKNKGITLVVAMIAAESLLTLGAAALPVYAGGDDGGVKQKAEAKAECDQKNKVEDGRLNVQDNIQGICAGISLNINDLSLID